MTRSRNDVKQLRRFSKGTALETAASGRAHPYMHAYTPDAIAFALSLH